MSIATAHASPTISETRRIASRINGAKGRGPKSDEGKAQSRLNALKHGLTGPGNLLPEDLAGEVDRYREDLTQRFRPRDEEERRLIDQAAIAAARVDHSSNVEFAQRLADAERARVGWDLDRAAEAEALGDRLGTRPARISAELRTKRHGCEWLIRRWQGLATVLDRQGIWDDAQKRLALDLLGLPAELRNEHPIADSETLGADLTELVDQEIRALRRLLRDVLNDRDAFNREMAALGFAYDISPASFRLRRYESASERLFHRCLNELQRRRSDTGSAPAPEPTPKQAPRPQRLPDPPKMAKPAERPTPAPAQAPAPLLAPAPLPAPAPFPASLPCRSRLGITPSAGAGGNRQARRAAAAQARRS
ncbi:hypothetical protein BH23PLA1_BH23PLA1_41850 [soil metagenome]